MIFWTVRNIILANLASTCCCALKAHPTLRVTGRPGQNRSSNLAGSAFSGFCDSNANIERDDRGDPEYLSDNLDNVWTVALVGVDFAIVFDNMTNIERDDRVFLKCLADNLDNILRKGLVRLECNHYTACNSK
eukprot:scaffold36304_cov206-Amphora_coffeaeformis.AAC.1